MVNDLILMLGIKFALLTACDDDDNDGNDGSSYTTDGGEIAICCWFAIELENKQVYSLI